MKKRQTLKINLRACLGGRTIIKNMRAEEASSVLVPIREHRTEHRTLQEGAEGRIALPALYNHGLQTHADTPTSAAPIRDAFQSVDVAASSALPRCVRCSMPGTGLARSGWLAGLAGL